MLGYHFVQHVQLSFNDYPVILKASVNSLHFKALDEYVHKKVGWEVIFSKHRFPCTWLGCLSPGGSLKAAPLTFFQVVLRLNRALITIASLSNEIVHKENAGHICYNYHTQFSENLWENYLHVDLSHMSKGNICK